MVNGEINFDTSCNKSSSGLGGAQLGKESCKWWVLENHGQRMSKTRRKNVKITFKSFPGFLRSFWFLIVLWFSDKFIRINRKCQPTRESFFPRPLFWNNSSLFRWTSKKSERWSRKFCHAHQRTHEHVNQALEEIHKLLPINETVRRRF